MSDEYVLVEKDMHACNLVFIILVVTLENLHKWRKSNLVLCCKYSVM